MHWSLDDWEQYAYLPAPDIGSNIETPGKVLELWTGELDAMRATGSLCIDLLPPVPVGPPVAAAHDRALRRVRARRAGTSSC